MPIYEYKCKQCSHQFEAIVYGSKQAKCPECESSKLEQRPSVFAVAGGSKSAGSASFDSDSGGGCGSCGDPRGPGACSMDDLD